MDGHTCIKCVRSVPGQMTRTRPRQVVSIFWGEPIFVKNKPVALAPPCYNKFSTFRLSLDKLGIAQGQSPKIQRFQFLRETNQRTKAQVTIPIARRTIAHAGQATTARAATIQALTA